jgi:cellulose synthase/poly-beta-1,6-N-acetylglucosamine synthase-like glycosyltransferase
MLAASVVAILLLVVLTLLPVAWAWRFVLFYGSSARHPLGAPQLRPRAAVILPLRGADPSLESCLTGLLNQTYHPYAVYIIVDSCEDPAHAVVQRVLARGYSPHVQVHVDDLRAPGERCSLKVSAQLQAIAQLPRDVEIIAFLDADSVPAADWLASLLAPLADPNVGAATGIRWFVPRDDHWGTWVRHVFNSAVCTQMYAFNIPWGGSLAFHRRVLERSNLLTRWTRCLSEDTSFYGPLREIGLRLEFVATATLVNAESTDLRAAFRFILRQLLIARLHHVHWPAIFLGNVGSFIALVACIALLACGYTNWHSKIGIAVLLLWYFAGMYCALIILERTAAALTRTARARSLSWKRIAAVPLTLVMAIFAMLATLFLRTIEWRGITYAIEGRDRIRLLAYRPYGRSTDEPTGTRSVL